MRALDLEPVIAVGYSMGGPVAMHLARRHPSLVAGLVVQATGLEWSGTRRERVLWPVFPIAGSWPRSRGYRRYLRHAVSRLLGSGHELEPYVPWLVSELSRNDAFATAYRVPRTDYTLVRVLERRLGGRCDPSGNRGAVRVRKCSVTGGVHARTLA